MPRMPWDSVRRLMRDSPSIVADGQGHLPVAGPRWSFAGGAGVPRDVGQRLLRDTVDDELLLLRERQAALQAPLHAHRRLLAERRGQRRQRALQAEILERLRPQSAPLCDARPRCTQARRSHATRRAASCSSGGIFAARPSICSIIAVSVWPTSSCSSRAIGCARLPAAAAPGGRSAPLGLQAVEHLVERPCQRGGIGSPSTRTRRRARAGRPAAHRRGQGRRAAGTPGAAAASVEYEHRPAGRRRKIASWANATGMDTVTGATRASRATATASRWRSPRTRARTAAAPRAGDPSPLSLRIRASQMQRRCPHDPCSTASTPFPAPRIASTLWR